MAEAHRAGDLLKTQAGIRVRLPKPNYQKTGPEKRRLVPTAAVGLWLC